jgi:hypothetical protein
MRPRTGLEGSARELVASNTVGAFWEHEHRRLSGSAGLEDYRKLEPTKWASLLRLRERVLTYTATRGHAIQESLELGCGTATLSIQLGISGVVATAVDREPAAIRLANEIASSVGVGDVMRWREEDFLESEPWECQADLVFSGGVLEHYSAAQLTNAYRRHRAATRRWVLIGIPNYQSSVFVAFVNWARRTGNLYGEEHLDIDVEALAAEHGDHVHWADGCHIMLGRARYVDRDDQKLAKHYCMIKRQLLLLNAAHRFPFCDFTDDDLELLVELESRVGERQRLAEGFMRWWLIERIA